MSHLTLFDLKVGDKVAIPVKNRMYDSIVPEYNIHVVERMTATQAVLSRNVRIALKNGSIVGNAHHFNRARVATEDLLTKHRQQVDFFNRHTAAANALADLPAALDSRSALTLAQKEALAKAWADVKAMA